MYSDRFKGYFFALLATISYSCVYIFSKAAMNEIGQAQQVSATGTHLSGSFDVLLQFLFYQFLFAFTLNAIWSATTGKFRLFKNLNGSQIRIFLLLGLMEILTNTSFYLSIFVISNPSVTSFLGNLYPVILTLMGVAFLKERFNRIEILGVILALIGAFFVSLRKMEFSPTFSHLFIPGTLIVLVNAILASTTSIIGKINVRKLTPELITLNATLWPLISATVLMIVFRESWTIPAHALANIAAGSFLGPFMGVLLIYYSFKFIEVSRSSIVQSLKGIIVLIGTVIYFGTLPETHQIIFGLLSVVGVVIMTLAQAGFLKPGRAFRK